MEKVLIRTKIKYYIFSVVMFISITTIAQQYTVSELKTAYLYNFSKFVEWPESEFESEQSNFIITILGESSVSKVLNKVLENKFVKKHKIYVRIADNVNEIKKSHIVFITQEHHSDIKKVVSKFKNKPVLTIGDALDNFCQSGGIINLTKKDSKTRFEINNHVALQSGLKISSKLLVLSKILNSE